MGKLHKQCTFTNTRLTSQQGDAAGHYPTAKDVINLSNTAYQALFALFSNGCNALRSEFVTTFGHRCQSRRGYLLFKRVPFTAVWAATAPTAAGLGGGPWRR